MEVRKQIRIIVLSGLILVLLLLWFFIVPQIKAVKKAARAYAIQKNVISILEAQKQSFENYKKNYPSYEKTIERIQGGFVNPQEPLVFIEFLEREATTTNLQINISPFETKINKEDLWKSTGFRIKLAGSFSSFLTFLSHLEQSQFLVDVSSVNVEKIQERINEKVLKELEIGDIIAEISLRVFSSESVKKKK